MLRKSLLKSVLFRLLNKMQLWGHKHEFRLFVLFKTHLIVSQPSFYRIILECMVHIMCILCRSRRKFVPVPINQLDNLILMPHEVKMAFFHCVAHFPKMWVLVSDLQDTKICQASASYLEIAWVLHFVLPVHRTQETEQVCINYWGPCFHSLSNAFSWMKMYEFRLIFHWSLFPRPELTIFLHWFK